MSEVAVEAIILAINALGGGILLFVSGVVQKMMTMGRSSSRNSQTFSAAPR